MLSKAIKAHTTGTTGQKNSSKSEKSKSTRLKKTTKSKKSISVKDKDCCSVNSLANDISTVANNTDTGVVTRVPQTKHPSKSSTSKSLPNCTDKADRQKSSASIKGDNIPQLKDVNHSLPPPRPTRKRKSMSIAQDKKDVEYNKGAHACTCTVPAIGQ